MDNSTISGHLSLLSKLIDIHGDDSFKSKTYSVAAFTIDKLPVELNKLSQDKIQTIKGIGKTTSAKIKELMETGRLAQLDEYLLKTPTGVLELLKIKGLGPKKISTIWKELGVESVGELLYACEENRLSLYKGFGAKTQENIAEAIRFYLACQGSYLFRDIEVFAEDLTQKLHELVSGARFFITGDFARHAEVIHKLEWVTDASITVLEKLFKNKENEITITGNILWTKGSENVALEFHCENEDTLIPTLFKRNCSNEFLEAWQQKYPLKDGAYASEEEVFKSAALPFIPPYLRENPEVLERAATGNIPAVIEHKDIRGIIHTHSDWSDGSNTIEVMAKAAIKQGFEYLVISDHSQTANYAGGLLPDRIKGQHELIDELNEKLHPFKIFKSIESDILNEGSLDYTEDILASFDLVIASVHSNLKMGKEKAMTRLLNAIANPFTTILGHMTGRLLLSRNGYPVDYDEIIAACAEHNVVIELNANPRRLDMDWRYIQQALANNVLISIDPDAHSVSSFKDIRYGVLVAQKAMLTPQHNLSSFTLQEFEAFLQKQKEKR